MGFFTKDEVYRKAASFNEVDMDIKTATDEIAVAEAENAEAMRPINMKIRAIEEVQEDIQKHGMSRPMAERLRDITGDETLLEAHGVALESFTLIPSRNNLQVGLEVSENAKGYLIGAGALLAFGIVAKIVHWIYKFFKGRKETDNNRKEAEQKVADKAKELKDAEDRLGKEKLSQAMRNIVKNADEYESSVKVWTQSYNNVMDAMLFNKNNDILKGATGTLMNMQAYESNGKLSTEHALWILGEIENPANNFESESKKRIEECYNKLPPADMRKNLGSIKELLEMMETKVEPIEINEVDVEKIFEQMVNVKENGFWVKLSNYSPWKKDDGFFSGDYDKKVDKLNTDLRTHAEVLNSNNSKLSPEFLKEFKEFTNYYKEQMDLLLKCVSFYGKLSKMWENFLDKTSRVCDIVKRESLKPNPKKGVGSNA